MYGARILCAPDNGQWTLETTECTICCTLQFVILFIVCTPQSANISVCLLILFTNRTAIITTISESISRCEDEGEEGRRHTIDQSSWLNYFISDRCAHDRCHRHVLAQVHRASYMHQTQNRASTTFRAIEMHGTVCYDGVSIIILWHVDRDVFIVIARRLVSVVDETRTKKEWLRISTRPKFIVIVAIKKNLLSSRRVCLPFFLQIPFPPFAAKIQKKQPKQVLCSSEYS